MNLHSLRIASPYRTLFTAVFAAILTAGTPAIAQGKTEPGLVVTFKSGEATDITVVPNAWVYAEAGRPVSPFVPAGPFTATWDGFINVDLRDSYSFSAELKGAVKVEINGAVVLEGKGDGQAMEASKPVRLNKGNNPVKIQFTGGDGDSFLRFFWQSAEISKEPVPFSALVHDAGAAGLKESRLIREGRDLFVEHRCSSCHETTRSAQSMIELGMAGPSFEKIGSRRNHDWMVRWIQNPKALRPQAHMPKLLHGAGAESQAQAMAAYLSSLKQEGDAGLKDPAADLAGTGKEVFEKLHCTACHIAPDAQSGDEKHISLKQVKAKFSTGTLTTFLARPDANHEWTRMPNFHLTKEEADQLAAYILANGDEPKSVVASSDTALLEKGAKLLESTGCIACHGGTKLKNELKSKPAADLAAAQWNKGCMADEPDAKAPAFGFSSEQKAALRAFAATDRQSLQRHVPADFAERQTKNLNCTECHGKIDGFPGLPILGGKLKPEWAASFIGGKVSYKPRPWLEARMPAFVRRADALAQGLAMEHGLPPKTPAQAEVDKEASEIGRTLVGSDGGLSCLACHAVGKLGATQVFESAGINFAYTGERLQQSYFHRWLLNPLRVDPQTKMPVYFDQGRSPLGDYYGGDAHKQVDALWNYIRLGPNMPLPKDANANQ